MMDKVMDGAETAVAVERKRLAYDPQNLAPEDEEARKYDDTSDGIDWDEIIVSNQDDLEAGRLAFNSADYATPEEAEAALNALLDAILQEALREREVTALSTSDSQGAPGY